MRVTSTPCGASSARAAFPIASSACFVIEYGPNAGPDMTPAIDDTMMMRPDPFAIIRGNTACVIASVPNTLTSKR